MPFGFDDLGGPKEPHIRWGSDALMERSDFKGEGATRCELHRLSAVSCAKTAEPIDMPFGFCTPVGPRKYVLGGAHTGATWRILLNRPCAAAMRPVVKLL